VLIGFIKWITIAVWFDLDTLSYPIKFAIKFRVSKLIIIIIIIIIIVIIIIIIAIIIIIGKLKLTTIIVIINAYGTYFKLGYD
jgi:hypothetical protein